jgi:hypothetical protein
MTVYALTLGVAYASCHATAPEAIRLHSSLFISTACH